MNPTIRCDAPRSANRALARSPIAVAIMLSVAMLIATGKPAAAQPEPGGTDVGEAAIWLQNPPPSPQTVPFTGAYNLQTVLGADRFYNAGFTGTSAVMANIEAGYIWNAHESLSHTGLIPVTGGAAGQFDRHATWVGTVMGGRPTYPGSTGDFQRGMAPNAQLNSGAIATSWPNNGAFTTSFFLNFFGLSTFGPYRAAFITGVPAGARPADVINSSWVAGNSSSDLAGIDNLSGTFDALIAANPRTLLTWAAGNTVSGGAGPNRVPTAGSAYNNLTVAGLTPNGGAFDQPVYFSNGGPNDYSDPTNGTIFAIRQVVDIAAPAENFGMAYYGGKTGGNPPGSFDPLGGPNFYSRNINGTSFSAPAVAGGAALLYDAAYALLGAAPDARDSRVMKAVLLNSAAKTQGWDNGQTANTNGFGGILTTRGLDNRVGAGRMDLNRAYDQLLSGTTDVLGTTQGSLGNVSKLGWDFGQANEGTTNDYLITQLLQTGDAFTATLTWFRDRSLVGETSFSEASFDNLDLELWSTLGGVAQNLISASNSRYNNTEHFTFGIPVTGQYMLRVRWTEEVFDVVGDLNMSKYGLAWSTSAVPEPAAFALLLLGATPLLTTRRRTLL